MAYADKGFMGRQYHDASKLNARISLHERFGTNPRGLQRWVFDHFDLPEGARILEVGCGPGLLWTENLGRIPAGWSVTLTDASPGMVAEAKRRLGTVRTFGLRAADVQGLPFRGSSFDAVVANHMLYHVPDRPKAISEISRVLKPGGSLLATTNGRHTHREMGWMQRILDPSRPTEDYFATHLEFSLENGEGQLSPWFPDVELRRYKDALAVTEAGPLVAYLLSGAAVDAAAHEASVEEFNRRVSTLSGRLERMLALRGTIIIEKDTGMFIARG